MLIIDRLKNKINAIVMRRSMANGPEPASPPVPPEDIHIEDKITMLGWYYKEQGRYAQAEAIFKKAIEANPKNSRTYFILGDYYYDRQRYTEAAKVYEQVLTITPGEVEASARLGKCYQIIGRREEARMVLKKALEVNPGSHRACTMLAGWYTDAGRYKEAEAMYKKAIEIQPNDPLMYTDLELCYLRQGKYDEAEFTLKKAIEVNPRKDRLYSALAYVYEKQGKRKLAEGFFERASRLRAETYNPVTRTNYRKLADTVLSSGIRLVCVQYPVRRIGPLEKMLKGIGGIIFVDNESVFKNALKEGRYEDYFIDCFGGDSGHCTPAGNKLLAENIANVILKELQ
ncbi:MAG: hypothetical protein COV72_05455 [Candidatus Omnitrophica bacterium CG11_big_fil_rev_8_21_14_0_20_42_13]|uniref:Uncharacterized protein n=1 Tax=Candidatus Ghiorseimicrobium undicola TaxID=1974746 RepID=A0A2H0LX32_9BACT|nr:MAG: hypothetical protein COV72_05455 [Candidatus Omnitrophica bacterium CG11_big_fil_rev_8_21_14_0_20_42_13]